jgi:hypothetical protein
VWLRKCDAEGNDESYPLCNFTARIVEEVVLDDGSAETDCRFVIEGALASGRALAPARVAAGEFASLGWVLREWGSFPVVNAGWGARDHLRAAIQLLSPEDRQRRHVYRHTGWRQVNGAWSFLHAGGAITAAGPTVAVNVELDGKLAAYHLPDPTTGPALVEAIRASLDLLDLAAARIMGPLLGAVYRAPLGQADAALFVDGPTGVGKSELAALAQQHFGAGLDRLSLPGSWTSTANALEAQAFLAKDVLFVVDDFKPGGSRSETDGMHAKADRLFRSVGNGSDRGRCWADGTVRAAWPPRCFILSTGEDRPRGESCAARRLDLHLGRGDIELAALTPHQQRAAQGVYAAAMAAYVRWLAGRLDQIKAELREEFKRLRALALVEGHPRTPGILADLACGWRFFLDFAEDAGAVTAKQREALWARAWKGLAAAARKQAEEIRSQEPARRFLALLASALSSSRAHVANTEGQAPDNAAAWGWQPIPGAAEPRAGGPCIGWVEGENLYLDPDAAYAAAQRLAEDQGERLAVGRTQLHKRLKEEGFLASTEKRHLTNRRTILGAERTILHVHTKSLAYTPGESAGSAGSAGIGEKPNVSSGFSSRTSKNEVRDRGPKVRESAAQKDKRRGERGGRVPAGPGRSAGQPTLSQGPDEKCGTKKYGKTQGKASAARTSRTSRTLREDTCQELPGTDWEECQI